MKQSFRDVRDLKVEMMNQAMKVMKAFQSDLVYDFESIDRIYSNKCEPCYWIVRERGTHLYTDYEDLMESVNRWGDQCKIIAKIDCETHYNETEYCIRYTKYDVG